MRIRALFLLLAVSAGCARTAAPPVTVLRTEDFVADQATMPTNRPAAPTDAAIDPSAPVRTAAKTAAEAREGIKEVSVTAGPPPAANKPASPVKASEAGTLVDAKIGEINGRPIRIDEVFADIGLRLETIARTRRMSAQDAQRISRSKNDFNQTDRPASRTDWLALASLLFEEHLNSILNDELLTAEARASLKPEVQAGLRNFVQEAVENRRRTAGGSRAELDRQLRAKAQSEQTFSRDFETKVLLEFQLREKFRNRSRITWKDARLYYERNADIFQPPLSATFRLISVSADNAAAVETVKSALAGGKAFDQVASFPENEFNRSKGGILDTPFQFRGEYSKEEFFPSGDPRNAAVQKLTEKTFTPEPVEYTDRAGRKSKQWLYLESIEDRSRSLSDPDVQLEIFRRLNDAWINESVGAYIAKLKERASFSDIKTMTQMLVDIAAERYWPAGS